jgi:HEAT repeat protein
MKLRRTRQPDVPALLANGDVDALIEAARFRDVKRDPDGRGVDQGVEVREQAILALGELGAGAGDDTVAAALRDPFDRVRCAAVHVLRTREEVEALAGGLSWLPGKARSRKLAARALLELRSVRSARAAARSLVRAAGNASLSDADISLLLGMLNGDEVPYPIETVIVRELLNALADDRGEVGDRAQDTLVRLAPISTAGVVGELASGSSPERAASVLGRIRDPKAMPALSAALENPRLDVRLQATSALGALRDPAAVEPLLRALHDSDPDVRAEASHALDGLGSAAVIVGLSAVLGPMIRDAVASAMERPARAEAPKVVRPHRTNGSAGVKDARKQARGNGGSPQ